MEQLIAADQDVSISAKELEQILLDTGKLATEAGALIDAEADEAANKPEAHTRRKKLSTGHKLRILAELKVGFPPNIICQNHRISRTTLALIAADDELQEISNTSFIEHSKKMVASRFYHLADMALSHIDPRKLERLDAYKLGMLAAIALDKARLIEGQSTENITFKSLALNIQADLADLRSRKMKLVQLLEIKMNRETSMPV